MRYDLIAAGVIPLVIVGVVCKLKKEVSLMVELYVALVIAGKRTFAKVPAKFQPAVKELLEALGLDEDGNPIE